MTATVTEGGASLLLLPGDGSSHWKEAPRHNLGSMYLQPNQHGFLEPTRSSAKRTGLGARRPWFPLYLANHFPSLNLNFKGVTARALRIFTAL